MFGLSSPREQLARFAPFGLPTFCTKIIRVRDYNQDLAERKNLAIGRHDGYDL